MKTNTLDSSISALSNIVTMAIGDCREDVTAEHVQQIISVTAKALADAVTVLRAASEPVSESCRVDS